MTVNGWNLLKMAENGWKWLEIDENIRTCLGMAGNVWDPPPSQNYDIVIL